MHNMTSVFPKNVGNQKIEHYIYVITIDLEIPNELVR